MKVGIDGWKLDFGENYIKVDPVATAEGPKAHQAYSERYYEDFLAYGQAVRGPEFLAMVRAYDKSYEFEGRFYAKKENAPVAWMGDNRRDWLGLADALDHMFRSAQAGYVVVGSDLGGYLDRDDQNLLGPQIPFDTLNVARWTAQSAMTPFMQLHSRGNLAPWQVPDHVDETIVLYKYWATLHHALVPFYASLAAQAYAGGADARSILRPIGDVAAWAHDYRYQLGDAFLVAPLLDATGRRTVLFRAGAQSPTTARCRAASPTATSGSSTRRSFSSASPTGRRSRSSPFTSTLTTSRSLPWGGSPPRSRSGSSPSPSPRAGSSSGSAPRQRSPPRSAAMRSA